MLFAINNPQYSKTETAKNTVLFYVKDMTTDEGTDGPYSDLRDHFNLYTEIFSPNFLSYFLIKGFVKFSLSKQARHSRISDRKQYAFVLPGEKEERSFGLIFLSQ